MRVTARGGDRKLFFSPPEQTRPPPMKGAIRANFDESADAYGAYERRTGRFGDLAERLGNAVEARGDRIGTALDAGAGTGASTRRLDREDGRGRPRRRVPVLLPRHARPSAGPRRRADLLAGRGRPAPGRGRRLPSRRLDFDRVVALDLSAAMLAANPADERVQADFDRLPFADDTFDAVVFTASLFLSPSPARTAAEAARVLETGGVVGAVAPLGWTDGDGGVFADLERDARSPSGVEDVHGALEAVFDVESGVWSFPTTAADLRAFHAIPAMAARLYPRLDTEERLERAATLLADVEGPLEQRWRWFVGR